MSQTLAVLLVLASVGLPPGRDSQSTQVAQDCDRDIQGDLLTIRDRLDAGRLDAARAYAEDLLACPHGDQQPGVHLAVAEIEQRLGRLNDAHRALVRAAEVAQEADRAAVVQATIQFRSRWVAVDLFPSTGMPSDPPLEHAGLVTDGSTARCLEELASAVQQATVGSVTSPMWLVPGDYRQGEILLRLPPGSRYTLKVAKATPPGAP